MFFVAVGTDHQPKNLKCGGCTWFQPAENYTYVRYMPDTYVPGISRLPRYVVYDTKYVDTSILVRMFWPPLLLDLLLLLLCRRRAVATTAAAAAVPLLAPACVP